MVEQANQLLDGVEFTHRWYRRFLRRLLAEGYDFRVFSDRLGDGDVVLRHDVDLSLDDALRMARLEADLGIQSTYCVLLTSGLYNPFEGNHRDTLREIESLGHEVALHFSTHEYWSAEPDKETIVRRIDEERSILERIVSPTETVSFHRPPSWVLAREFREFRNTYAPAYFTDIGYVADSSQRWREDPPPLKDLPATLQVLTHPGLWGDEDTDFDSRIDQAINNACGNASRHARREFITGEVNR